MKRQRSLKTRIILMLLCAAMVLSCSIPALAAESATAQEIIRLKQRRGIGRESMVLMLPFSLAMPILVIEPPRMTTDDS